MSVYTNSKNMLIAILLSCISISSSFSKDHDIVDLTPMRGEPTRSSEISVVKGQKIQIKLQNNAGTPSNWQCASSDNSIADIEDLGVQREVPKNDGMVGYRQNRRFAISAIKSGIATIKCDLSSFNGQSYSATDLTVSIQ